MEKANTFHNYTEADKNVIILKNLSYQYNSNASINKPFMLDDISLTVTQGSRVLIVGTNGAGKSTLLSILGGKKLIPEDQAMILGRPAFHDFTLRNNIVFLGDPWNKDYCYGVTLRDLLKGHADTPRVTTLAKFLDIDLDWTLSFISDGQRKRSQLLFNFIYPREVYLLDEVTTDLDLIARDGLFRLLMEESISKKSTILYATHIFDDMEGWPTHILYLSKGKLKIFSELNSIEEYQAFKNANCYNPLYQLIRSWFLMEKDEHIPLKKRKLTNNLEHQIRSKYTSF